MYKISQEKPNCSRLIIITKWHIEVVITENKTEQHLIGLAIDGDQTAFEELIRRYYHIIYRIAYKWCGNQVDAEDVTQDVCIRIGQALKGFKNDASFSTWLYRITLNRVRDLQRSYHSEQKKVEAMSLISEPHFEPDCETEMTQNQLWEEVKKLPDKQRDAVLLVHSEGLNHKEAAMIMECSESTVSWHIHEAKKRLKSLFVET